MEERIINQSNCGCGEDCTCNECESQKYSGVHEILRKDSKGKIPIYPLTYIQAVFDKRTGVGLETILAQFNNVFLQYQGTPYATRNFLPVEMRRKGIIISYKDMKSEIITEKCVNDTRKDDNHWGLDSNWVRIDELSLSGDISVSVNGTWVINGEDTGIKALGPRGDNGLTPWLKTINNKLYHSYDNENWELSSDYIAAWFRVNGNKLQMSRDNSTWETVSDYIASWFRWHSETTEQGTSIGKIQMSRDNGATWDNFSGNFTNNLRISGYVSDTASLPSNAALGTIYGVGPTYDEADTEHTNPIYRIYVKASNGWVDNGSFTSIAAGVVQELGDSETEVMSQKATTDLVSVYCLYKHNSSTQYNIDEALNFIYDSGKASMIYPGFIVSFVNHSGIVESWQAKETSLNSSKWKNLETIDSNYILGGNDILIDTDKTRILPVIHKFKAGDKIRIEVKASESTGNLWIGFADNNINYVAGRQFSRDCTYLHKLESAYDGLYFICQVSSGSYFKGVVRIYYEGSLDKLYEENYIKAKSFVNQNDALKVGEFIEFEGMINSNKTWFVGNNSRHMYLPISNGEYLQIVNRSGSILRYGFSNTIEYSPENSSECKIDSVNELSSGSRINLTYNKDYKYIVLNTAFNGNDIISNVYIEIGGKIYNKTNTELIKEYDGIIKANLPFTIDITDRNNRYIPLQGSVRAGDTIALKLTNQELEFEGNISTAVYLNDVTNNINYCVFNTNTADMIKTANVEKDSDNIRFVVVFAGTGTVVKFRANVEVFLSEKYNLHYGKTSESTYRYIVSKDGGGDYSSIVKAVLANGDKKNVYIDILAGDYDLLQEFEDYYGSDFFTNYTESNVHGLLLDNGIYLNFSPKANVYFNYKGSNEAVMTYFAPITSGRNGNGFTIEGMNLRASKCRYAIHDERGSDTIKYQNKYIGCNIYFDNRENTAVAYRSCIGGGLGVNGDITVEKCIFESEGVESTKSIVSWHNSASEEAKSKLQIINNFFKRGTFEVRWYGKSEEVTTALVVGNSFTSEPLALAENASSVIENVKLYAWNNEIRTN